MEEKSTKKTDRRTLYTRMVIKNALIELMKEKPFNKITVKELCSRAEINRGTLYLHYLDLPDVLDEIENDVLESMYDELNHLGIYDENRLLKTQDFFNSLADKEIYNLLAYKQASFSKIIEKSVALSKGDFLIGLKNDLNLNDRQAECLFTFLVNGCSAVCRDQVIQKNNGWNEYLNIIDKFIEGGLSRLKEK